MGRKRRLPQMPRPASPAFTFYSTTFPLRPSSTRSSFMMHVRELLSNGQVQVFIWARQSLQRSLRGHFYNLIRLPFSLRLQLHNDWQNEGWLEIVICFFLKKVFWPLCLGCSRSFFNCFFFLTFTSGCVIWVDIVCIFWSHTKRPHDVWSFHHKFKNIL